MLDFLEDIWEAIVEGASYIFSFEWFGDVIEGFGDLFDGLGEFNFFGMGFAVFALLFLYFTAPYMLTPFTKFMSMGQKWFWTIATYAATAIVGYFIGTIIDNKGD